MGDGRYYTYHQFFDILLLICLLIFVIGNLIYCHYRKNRDNNLAYINIPLILTIMFCIVRMIETVIPNLLLACRLRNVECGLLVFAITIFSLDKKMINTNKKSIVAILISIIAILFFNGIFVKSYEFHNVIYESVYKLLLMFSLTIWFFFKYKRLACRWRKT